MPINAFKAQIPIPQIHSKDSGMLSNNFSLHASTPHFNNHLDATL
jgi:hypothetical protein